MIYTDEADVAASQSFPERSKLWKTIRGDEMVIGRVDEEVVVLDLNVGFEARVEDCHDFIQPQGHQLRIIWNNLCLVSSVRPPHSRNAH